MKTKRIENKHFYGCPIEAALDVIGNKWKGVILYHLMQGTKRFNELRRLIPNVSQRILTLQLRELEEDNVIIRKVYAVVPPKVEYSLTDLGKKLEYILSTLEEWGKQVMQQEGKNVTLSI
jgi:DNA-binding HxlR family transcriptional regulator